MIFAGTERSMIRLNNVGLLASAAADSKALETSSVYCRYQYHKHKNSYNIATNLVHGSGLLSATNNLII